MKYRFLLIALFSLIIVSCKRSPQQMFNALFDEDKLKSAKVLHAEDQSFGEMAIWLHFTIDSIELVEELKNCDESGKYIRFSIQKDYGETEWWNPQSMGKNIKEFQRKEGRTFETFYVNESFTEVYYMNAL